MSRSPAMIRRRLLADALAAVQARLSVSVQRRYGSIANACDQVRQLTVPQDVVIGCPLE